jgi:valyl-tRNA synthetase
LSKQPKFSKKYNPLIEEEKIFHFWQENELFRFKNTSQKKQFIIDTPPPYTNASWHIGGAIHYSQIDMIARTMRMFGYEVLFPMGLDRNGLPIEIQAEKENNIKINEIPREEFLRLCHQLLDKYGSQILNLIKKLGLSCNSYTWEKIYKTDEYQFRALTQETFIELYNKGLIYEDDRPTNWDIILQTTISDAEIEYKELIHTLYTIKLKLVDSDDTIAISTTRPELFPSVGIIIYNPTDERYQTLYKKEAIIPIWNLRIPILPHPYAKADFGSGLVMICSYGDLADVQIFRELKLLPKYSITLQGTLSDQTGKYAGLNILEGRKAIINDLKDLSLIINEKKITYLAPTSERSGAMIEFIGMKEFYINQIDSIEKLKNLAKQMKFFPDHSRSIWINWLEKINIDWPISRRRYYGTEIPLWYCNSCNNILVPPPGPYYQPWKDECPIKQCPNCANTAFTGETRILDTWMDSSNSAIYIRKYPENLPSSILSNFSSTPYIADIRVQGKDIVRTWLHYSMLKGDLLFSKPMFDKVWISGHVLDKYGYKMSKSKGNTVKPEPIIEKYGADALRLFGASESSHGSDIRFNESKLAGQSKFFNKLFNISKFISNFEYTIDFNTNYLYESDIWILSELSRVLENAYEGLRNFDFSIPANLIIKFTWDLFSNHYLEMVKHRLFSQDDLNSKQSCIWTLNYVLDAVLRVLAPIIPYVTEYLYLKLYNISIHKQLFQNTSKIPKKYSEETTELLKSFNTSIWKMKQELKISLKEPIELSNFPENLSQFKSDLLGMHNLKIKN